VAWPASIALPTLGRWAGRGWSSDLAASRRQVARRLVPSLGKRPELGCVAYLA